MKDIIMSVDESLSSSGIAIFAGNALVDAKTVKTSGKMETAERLGILTGAFQEIIRQHHPTVFVTEDIYQKKSLKSYRYNLFIQGMLYAYCREIPDGLYCSYYPSQWRKILGISNRGNRDELKARDIEYVRNHLGMLVDDDIADGICLGLAYLKEMNDFASKSTA